MLKKCRTCRLDKPIEEYSKSRQAREGVRATCKKCAKIQRARWYGANREREKAKATAYAKSHPEKARIWQEKAQARGRTKYNAHKREHYARIKEKVNAALRARYKVDAAYRDMRLERAAALRGAGQKTDKAYMAEYRRENRQRLNLLALTYTARKAGARGSISAQEWQTTLNYFGRHCAYCLKHETEVGTLAADHMTPLVRGGDHDIANIAPACRGCNSSKGAATPLEFIARQCGRRITPPRNRANNLVGGTRHERFVFVKQ